MDPLGKNKEGFRAIPSVGGLIGSEKGKELAASFGEHRLTNAIRDAIEALKQAGNMTAEKNLNEKLILRMAEKSMVSAKGGLIRVINATGIVLHTNLGRAPLSQRATAAATQAAEGYTDLEFDLKTGLRGSRQSHGSPMIAELLGAEAAIIVNNNAAAILLCLDSLAKGLKVAVSRGELVEIGGSFRVPEIMSATGAFLMEVGTTNRTRPSDFEKAASDGASMLLKVHPSNFKITGFTSEASVEDMSRIAKKHSIPFVYDIGSGAMLPTGSFGLPDEPMPKEALRQGADIVTFSGDKLFGGPQCGIIAGRKDLVRKAEGSPLARAFRVDKMRLAAICQTIGQYCDNEEWKDIPVLRMLSEGYEGLLLRATTLKRMLEVGFRGRPGSVNIEIVDTEDEVGGGSVPGGVLRGAGLRVTVTGMDTRDTAGRLRSGRYPVVALEKGSGMLFSMRTVADSELEMLSSTIIEAFCDGETG